MKLNHKTPAKIAVKPKANYCDYSGRRMHFVFSSDLKDYMSRCLITRRAPFKF